MNSNARSRYWAGVGSRATPLSIQTMMSIISSHLLREEMILRSGNANGADQAFAMGCPLSMVDIYTAKDATPESIDHAKQYHPNWTACSPYARRLHARNSMIILGRDLSTPVEFCICYTDNGKEIGGTGQAIRVCKEYQIPVYNMGDQNCLNSFLTWFKKEGPFPIPISVSY